MVRRVGRWHASLLATIVLAAAGLAYASPALFAAATLPLAFVAVEAVSSIGAPGRQLAVERRLQPRTPIPGETVHVELEVTNQGDRTLPDVRVVDGVPAELSVADGTASIAASLRPGETVVLEYDLRPPRGSYDFDDPVVRLRSLSGAARTTAEIEPAGPESLESRAHLEDVPVERRTTRIGGSVPSDTGGEGYEFYATREYRHGDPLNRVDWRRFAKTGSLGTVEFREHRATRVVVVVDGRYAARVRPEPGVPDGATLSAYAAVRVASALHEATQDVGLAALGVEIADPGVYSGPPAYVEPGRDVATVERILHVCDLVAAGEDHGGSGASGAIGDPGVASTGAAAADGGGAPERTGTSPASDASGADVSTVGPASSTPSATAPVSLRRTETESRLATLRTLLPADAQVVVCSPVLDDEIVETVEGLRAGGVPVTVLAPDVTHEETPGARVEAVRRRAALSRLRGRDVAVVDWDRTESLRTVLDARLAEVLR